MGVDVSSQPNITKLWKRKWQEVLMLTSKRRKRKELISMTPVFYTYRKYTALYLLNYNFFEQHP